MGWNQGLELSTVCIIVLSTFITLSTACLLQNHVFVTDDLINVEDALLNIISNIQSRFSLHENKQARCYLMEIEFRHQRTHFINMEI